MVFEEPGGVDRLMLVDVDRPQPGPDEVLLRVRRCGVNPLDRIVLSGAYPAKPMPHIPGSEVAGTVEELGDRVEGLSRGQRVVVYNRLFDGTCPACMRGEEQTCYNGGIIGVATQGGYAEFIAVPAANVMEVPKGLDLGTAAACTLSGLTAWHLVYTRGRLRAGETMLAFGATGSVGSFAVQLGSLAGARVLAVTRDPSKTGFLEDLGADAVLSTSEDVARQVADLTGGYGADLVVDPLGKVSWPPSFEAVARNGRWVTCGALTGRQVELDLMALYSQQIEVIGSTGGSRAELQQVLSMAASGRLRSPIWRRFPLESAPEALESLSSAKRVGKVMLEIS